MERYDARGDKDSEARHHVAGGLPPGGSGHEETETRKAGSALRRGVRGTDLHRHGVHGTRSARSTSHFYIGTFVQLKLGETNYILVFSF